MNTFTELTTEMERLGEKGARELINWHASHRTEFKGGCDICDAHIVFIKIDHIETYHNDDCPMIASGHWREIMKAPDA